MPRSARVGRYGFLGVGGLFGYHFVYFSAIRAAPPVEVSLIAYLWPLFLVVSSAFLPGERLKLHHLAGVALGLAGAVLIITRGKGLSLANGFELGHVLAFACSIIWAGYSVLSRRFGKVSTDVVAGFCLITALLSAFCHLMFETTVWPADAAAMECGAGAWASARWRCLLHLGFWCKARRYHGAGRGLLCIPSSFHAGARCCGLCAFDVACR